MKSQKEAVLNHLKTFGELTVRQAERLYGCRRLSARIKEFRDDGYNIETETVKFKTKYGTRGSYAKYVMKDGRE